MKIKNYAHIYTLFLMLAFCTSFGQNQTEGKKINISSETKAVALSQGPKMITRNMIQDREGNICMAAYDGIFKYDGKSFTNIINKVSSARFFSVLEDRKGNLWFGSIGSGVYCYNGRSFRQFTTKEGLAGNAVTCIYEDKKGNIWFGTEGGASCYNGKTFRNFTTKERERLSMYEVTAIVEDKTGKFWFATRGNAFVYDGNSLTVLNHNGKPFNNVRSIIEDKKGNIWFGGSDGLWRYNGSTFTNITQKFVGYVMEDKKGNIWTSSEKENSQAWALSRYNGKLSDQASVLSRYDGKSLYDKKPTVTEITSKDEMICGILEANDGSIWFGASDGLYRYDGNTIRGFNTKNNQK